MGKNRLESSRKEIKQFTKIGRSYSVYYKICFKFFKKVRVLNYG
nr:MAG TPA: hypothetical protein [Caudoviricetes sp.]